MMLRMRHHPPGQGLIMSLLGPYSSPAFGDLRSARSMKIGEPTLHEAASVRIEIILCRTGVVRFPPCHHMSNVEPVATPLIPSRVKSITARVPIRFVPVIIPESRFGFNGSRYGGTNNRSF